MTNVQPVETDDGRLIEYDKLCPKCGAAVAYDLECPGYGQEGKIMVCSSGCGNADEWRCMNENCDWWYREPNRRSTKDEMGKRPAWVAVTA